MNRILRGTGTIIAAVLMFALVGTTSAQAAPAVSSAATTSTSSLDWDLPGYEIPAKDKAILAKFCKDPLGTIVWLKKEILFGFEAVLLTKILPHLKTLLYKAELFFKGLIDLVMKHHGYESVTSLEGRTLKKPIKIHVLFSLCGSHGGGGTSS